MSYSNWKPLAYIKGVGGESALRTQVFDPTTFLRVYVRIAGYAGSAIAQLRFNSDASTANYAYRVSNNFAVPTTGVAGAAAGIKVSQTATVGARALLVFDIINIAGRFHGITWMGSDLSEAAATAPDIVVGSGLFASAGQIQWIDLEAGGSTFTAGTDVAVFGHDGAV